mgnify:CR=1 FL=1
MKLEKNKIIKIAIIISSILVVAVLGSIFVNLGDNVKFEELDIDSNDNATLVANLKIRNISTIIFNIV